MPKIILRGELDFDLTRLGLRPEMEVCAEADLVGKTGAMYFTVHRSGFSIECVVWPENYRVAEVKNVIDFCI